MPASTGSDRLVMTQSITRMVCMIKSFILATRMAPEVNEGQISVVALPGLLYTEGVRVRVASGWSGILES